MASPLEFSGGWGSSHYHKNFPSLDEAYSRKAAQRNQPTQEELDYAVLDQLFFPRESWHVYQMNQQNNKVSQAFRSHVQHNSYPSGYAVPARGLFVFPFMC